MATPRRTCRAAQPAENPGGGEVLLGEVVSFELIEHLGDTEAREAVLVPAGTEGVRWDEEAVDLVVDEASGYPYFLQQLGQETWNAAAGPGVTLADARVGVALGRAALDQGFFRVRWDRATRAEQQFLRAMAEDGDTGTPSGTVAHRLGKSRSSIGPARSTLLAKGLIDAPEHGVVAFTVPGMADFIRRQMVA